MKKLVLIFVSVLFLGVTLNSCKPSDQQLQTAVETALKAVPGIPEGIVSEVKEGVATLTGVVETEDVKAAIETAVKAVKGLKSVANNIQVVPPVVINPDETLMSTISAAFTAAGFDKVVTAVQDGVVTLTGEAKKTDLEKIMQIANEASPKQVLNQLTLK
ncbi:MAG: BON domain-containing protein [Tannerella sp.]|jgi:osmotically-inducible protein OsmY|nr:BON domain-containing protein [Tannerella sp.]